MYYDCVIVGAGSTGCVLAARLSENLSRTVLLLEAGADFPDVASMPAALSTAAFDPSAHPEYVWTYEGAGTAHQTQSLAVIRGKVVGGSGAVNGANFIRNIPEDFDSWGSELWTFPSILPFFRKLEDDLDFTGEAHGSSGPIPVGRSPRESWSPFHTAFYTGALSAGFQEKLDLSRAQGSGIGPLPLNNINGVRMNSALAYLNPSRSRQNLTVQPHALALRVRFDRNRVSHVEALVRGRVQEIEAGEVILCAGGIESPHILMLSGIGPAGELRELGIDVIADVPGVGRNLTDHGTVQLTYRPTEGQRPYSFLPQTVALICTAPDSPYRNDLRIQPSVGFHAQSSATVGTAEPPQRMAITCILDRPTTTGRLKLTSSDPAVAPSLDFRYLDNPFDIERMRYAVRTAVRIVEDSTPRDVVSHRQVPLDGDLVSDAELDRWLMHNYRTAFHTCGTAKMGDAADATAVVDQLCRVRGVEGLRVADLSIMPVVGRGSMNPTAVMIGERVADLISS